MDRQYNSQPAPMHNTHARNDMNTAYQPHGNHQGGMNHGRPNPPRQNNARPPHQQSMRNNAPLANNQQSAQNDEPKRYMNIKSHGKSNAIEFAPDNTQKG